MGVSLNELTSALRSGGSIFNLFVGASWKSAVGGEIQRVCFDGSTKYHVEIQVLMFKKTTQLEV